MNLPCQLMCRQMSFDVGSTREENVHDYTDICVKYVRKNTPWKRKKSRQSDGRFKLNEIMKENVEINISSYQNTANIGGRNYS